MGCLHEENGRCGLFGSHAGGAIKSLHGECPIATVADPRGHCMGSLWDGQLRRFEVLDIESGAIEVVRSFSHKDAAEEVAQAIYANCNGECGDEFAVKVTDEVKIKKTFTINVEYTEVFYATEGN